MKQNPITISDILRQHCGGTRKVAKQCNIHTSTPEKWLVNGVPDRHWSTLMAMSDVTITANDIFIANERLRNP